MSMLRSRGSAAVLGVGLAVGVVFSTWYLPAGPLGIDLSSAFVESTAVLIEWVASLVAGLLVVAVAVRRRGAERWSWALFGVGVLLWSTGSLIWAVYLVRGAAPPYPGPMDPFYLCLPAALAVAVVVRSSDRRGARPLRTVVDGLLVASSILLVLWVGLLRLTMASGSGLSGSGAAMAVNLAYPVGDVIIITMLVGLVRRRTDPDRRALMLLTIGVGLVAVADLVLLVASAYGIYQDTPVVTDAPWTMGFVIIGGAAVVALRRPVDAIDPADGHPPGSGAVPIVLASTALLVGLVDLSLHRGGVPWTIPLMLVVVGFLLARQSLTLRENRRLSDDLAEHVRMLSHQARHDRLTGLPNRFGLTERLADAISSAGPTRWSAVVFVDIDHLKPINDSLGHDRGDALIRTVASRLEAGHHDTATRFGGDEFVVLLQGPVDGPGPGACADALVAEVSRPVDLDGPAVQPAVSVGVAVAGEGTPPAELLRRADTALYRAKSSGRRRAAVYDPTMDADSRRRIELEPELRRAVAEDEFEVHYQPVVDLVTGRLIGAEALLRWRHPTEGLLTPDRFLEDADAIGLLGTIGDRTLQQATRRFAEVNDRPGQTPVRVAVNLSASEMSTPGAVGRVQAALSASGLAPDLLVLEIREDVVVDDSIRRTIDELNGLGVGLALDDFGTGNSSLRQLGSYPASVLKVDRTFIDGLGTEAEDTFIVRAVLNLARNLGLQTVAEGVETEAQRRLLVELGCDAGQGWLFDRAVPFAEFDRDHLGGASVRHLRPVR